MSCQEMQLYDSRKVNPSAPRHKCRGLPSSRAQAEGSGLTLSGAFPLRLQKSGLSAVERVKGGFNRIRE